CTRNTKVIVVCFFFSSRRRHTRSLRDWSSDVCSSDLPVERAIGEGQAEVEVRLVRTARLRGRVTSDVDGAAIEGVAVYAAAFGRSEERRVGKECGSGVAAEEARKRKPDQS